jgi:hypothetical protein
MYLRSSICGSDSSSAHSVRVRECARREAHARESVRGYTRGAHSSHDRAMSRFDPNVTLLSQPLTQRARGASNLAGVHTGPDPRLTLPFRIGGTTGRRDPHSLYPDPTLTLQLVIKGAFGYTTILLLNCNTVTRTHHAAPVQLYPNP